MKASERHKSELEKISVDLAPKIAARIDEWRRRSPDAPLQIDPPRIESSALSATQVRLGWYIPPRHRNDTLKNFRPIDQSQYHALDAVREWVRLVRAGEAESLALVGPRGCGKSHLLYAAIRSLNLAEIHAAAFGWQDLADIRRDAKAGDEEARRQWSRFRAAGAFGIDEIRPTSGSEFDTTELSHLMVRAYRECQGVIVTSNAAGEGLEDIVGIAASSRLTEIVVVGPNMREPANRRKYLVAA